MNAFPKSLSASFVYFSLENNQIIFNKTSAIKSYTMEEKKRFKWQILQEKKQIGKYTCQKALGTFRGRKYTAWFTMAIPLPYGPRLVTGLSGVILEVKENTGMFHAKATSIKLSKTMDPKFLSKCEIYSKQKTIPIKDFFVFKRKDYEEHISRIRSRLPKGQKILNYNLNENPGLEIYTENTKISDN